MTRKAAVSRSVPALAAQRFEEDLLPHCRTRKVRVKRTGRRRAALPSCCEELTTPEAAGELRGG
jgi:hypothetical protein